MDTKVAIVFHGIVGGMDDRNGVGDPIDLETCYKTIHYNILSHYDTDVFIHSWSTQNQDILVSLYKPKKFLFQQQEYFNFKESEITAERETGQAYRALSRYTSLERAIRLKRQEEIEKNFRYKWVLVLRFDLIFFNRLNLDNLNNDFFYLCLNPEWPNIHDFKMVHDLIFLSNSFLIDKFSIFASEIRNKIYDVSSTHHACYKKIMNILNGDLEKVKHIFVWYTDIDIYRFIMHPEQNEFGQRHGLSESKQRLIKLISKIDNGQS